MQGFVRKTYYERHCESSDVVCMGLRWLRELWDAAMEALNAIADAIIAAVMAAWNAIKNAIMAIWNAILAILKAILDAILNVVAIHLTLPPPPCRLS